MNNFDIINVPEDTLERLLMGKATDGDQLLAHNAILAALKEKPPARVVSDEAVDVAIAAAWNCEDRTPKGQMRAALSALQSGAEGKDGDSALLDWLEVNEADLVTHRERENEAGEYSIWWNVVKAGKSISGHPLGCPREAIRYAMNTALQPGQGES